MQHLRQYHHVDNGGPALSINVPENREELEKTGCYLQLQECYYGYSQLSWRFENPTPQMLRKWSELLLNAAQILEGQTNEQFDV